MQCVKVAVIGLLCVATFARGQLEQQPARYEFNYAVNDPLTGDQKDQQETRNGDAVVGYYRTVDADGLLRTVRYQADDVNGFQAEVVREPVAGGVVKAAVPVQPAVVPVTPAAATVVAVRAPAAAAAAAAAPAPYYYGYQPYSAYGYQPYSAYGYQPYAAYGYQPYAAYGYQPYSAFGYQPYSAYPFAGSKYVPLAVARK